MNDVSLPNVDNPDDDPYLWLEEVEGERAVLWAEQQSQDTLKRFGGEIYEQDRDGLATLLDRPDKIPYIYRAGGKVYNFWKDNANPRGVFRYTTLEDYQTDAPSWQLIIDLDDLATAENEDWIWGGATLLPSDNDRALIYLSRGGSDATVIREFDLERKEFLTDGFIFPESKGGVNWLDRDTLLVSRAYGEGHFTECGYSRTVRIWKRGNDIEQAPVIFETDVSHMVASAVIDHTAGEERVFFYDKPAFFSERWWVGDREGKQTHLDFPEDCWLSIRHGWFILKNRSAWTVGDQTYDADSLLAIRQSDFLNGDRRFEVLFAAEERLSLKHFFWSGQTLVLMIFDNLAPRIEYWTISENGWEKTVQPDLPEVSTVSIWNLDSLPEEANGDLLAQVETPIEPPKFMLFRPDTPAVQLKQGPENFDASGLTVRRYEAVSVDGERIPYVQVGPETMTGDAPVHMFGYGGFELAEEPRYRTAIGKLWLERGGTSVIANIRGGDEFGTRWHKAGMREGKSLSHDDFAAVAADLVRRGVTRPERIAAEGGSNGGILITNMLTRYPKHFGALFCTIPLVDMRRYTKLLAGASWIAEYGDPDKEEDWAFIQKFSAYHQAIPGQSYPPILLATTRRDDRVHPGHARKMAAKLQAMGYPANYYELAAGGHGYGKNNRDMAGFVALGYKFLREAIGWESS